MPKNQDKKRKELQRALKTLISMVEDENTGVEDFKFDVNSVAHEVHDISNVKNTVCTDHSISVQINLRRYPEEKDTRQLDLFQGVKHGT